jgi:F0F1-type ATP synthase assembly protein I
MSTELLAGLLLGVSVGWYFDEWLRNSVVPALIRHGRR